MARFMVGGTVPATTPTSPSQCLCNQCELFGACGEQLFSVCPPPSKIAWDDYSVFPFCVGCPKKPADKASCGTPCDAVILQQMG